MKTAIQEAIELVKKYDNRKIPFLLFNLEQLLKKEKEQIIDAFEIGYKSCDIDEAFEINRKLASGELYYNQNYNQNK
jgi:hypothetical protein